MFTASELPIHSSNEYSAFGKNYPAFPDPNAIDYADKCLPGSWNANPTLAQLDSCESYMPARCSQVWDEKCDIYLANIQDLDKIRDFLNKAASNKFCRLSDDSRCALKCEVMDPMNQESPAVCGFYGNETLHDPTQTIDIGWYQPVDISPDYFSKCNQTCDRISNIRDGDPVIDKCLTTGLCGKALTNICQSAFREGIPINHQALNTFCSAIAPPSLQNTAYSNIKRSPPNPQAEVSKGEFKKALLNNKPLSLNMNFMNNLRYNDIIKILVILVIISILILIWMKIFNKKSKWM